MTAQQDNLEMTPLRCSYCDHHAVTWECEICERRGFDVPVPERQAEISTPIAENDNTDVLVDRELVPEGPAPVPDKQESK